MNGRRKLSHGGTLVLDSEGLSKLLTDDEQVVALVAEARSRGMEAVIRVRVVPVGDEEAKAASKLLMSAGLHGHKYAIDAAVAEAALRQHRPVITLTSDVDDMAKLCGDRVRLVTV